MARHRKHQSGAIRLAPVLKAALLCSFIGGSGVGYVWQRNQIYELSQQIKQLETRREQLLQQNKTYRGRLVKLCSPLELEARLRKANLGLVLPQQDQVLRLIEPPGDGTAGSEHGHYAIR